MLNEKEIEFNEAHLQSDIEKRVNWFVLPCSFRVFSVCSIIKNELKTIFIWIAINYYEKQPATLESTNRQKVELFAMKLVTFNVPTICSAKFRQVGVTEI